MRVWGEWHARGNIISFARRSQRMWRSCVRRTPRMKVNSSIASSFDLNNGDGTSWADDDQLPENSSIMSQRKKNPSSSQKICSTASVERADNISNLMIFTFLSLVGMHVWQHHSEE